MKVRSYFHEVRSHPPRDAVAIGLADAGETSGSDVPSDVDHAQSCVGHASFCVANDDFVAAVCSKKATTEDSAALTKVTFDSSDETTDGSAFLSEVHEGNCGACLPENFVWVSAVCLLPGLVRFGDVCDQVRP